ncbi:hypothetical protein EDD53_2587 [Pacificibacter maritimus]|uniref:Uncharacterized protein n=1 Tax=Pacificibacter maritimus TaxID=762213 RepID=A0A3N4U1X1_9RHOB|nr:iron-containing alcohol dehydrogenase [Pacificibacter maritimus]RPE64823.1 hypothetical protein EDD53_2587 [Pacificibacter maritimus]
MLQVTPFSFSCKTQVHFGENASQRLLDNLPVTTQNIVLIKGVSDRASAPVRAVLSHAGLAYETQICGSEPSIDSINALWLALKDRQVDCIIACGGGSVLDTGKALRLALLKGAPLDDRDFTIDHNDAEQMPLIVLPTTAGTGSEVTANAVLSSETKHSKISLRGQGLVPSVAIVDPALMRAAPKSVTLYAGLDAVVQNIEAYTSAFATPFSRALAQPAIHSTLSALRAVIDDDRQDAWAQLAWGSLSSGVALANGGLGAVHGLAAVLGGVYDAPHGALCGRLLIPVMTANLASSASTPAIQRDIELCLNIISDIFTPIDPAQKLSGLEAWLDAQSLPRLAHWGITADRIDILATAAATASSSLKNPVKLTPAELAKVLNDGL